MQLNPASQQREPAVPYQHTGEHIRVIDRDTDWRNDNAVKGNNWKI
jgi:hypothetical protein